MSGTYDAGELTDAVKASVSSSGALANLKGVSYHVASNSGDDSMEDLKQEAQNSIKDIKQLLDVLNPDIGVSQKLRTALVALRTALANGAISRMALESALAEAVLAISDAGGDSQDLTPQQKAELLWQRVEADNKDIDDDFDKMRKAGILFNDGLWNKHKELMEHLQTHPRDIAKQKELDAVDDAMLLQAEPQLVQHPDAKPLFEDAKKKSDDRHEAVDKALVNTNQTFSKANATLSAFDDDAPASTKDHTEKLTMNDVTFQPVGQKSKPAGKQYS